MQWYTALLYHTLYAFISLVSGFFLGLLIVVFLILLLAGLQELQRFGVKVNDDGCINPFLPETIEFMLYSLPITSTKVCHVGFSSSRFVVGSTVELCGVQHHIREKLAMGGFASIFVASTDEGLKALKVRNSRACKAK